MNAENVSFFVLEVDEFGNVVKEIISVIQNQLTCRSKGSIESLYDLVVDEDITFVDSFLYEACHSNDPALINLRLKTQPEVKHKFSAIRLNCNLLVIGGDIGNRYCEKAFEEMMLINNALSNLLRKTSKELAACRQEYQDKHLTMYREISEANNDLANTQRMLAKKNAELETAINDIKLLSKMIPICSNCKKIRDDDRYWQNVDSFLSERSKIIFSHSVCPDCFKVLYPELIDRK